jgi:uncharacterized protein Yka (UPF0111/DUF47 family)
MEVLSREVKQNTKKIQRQRKEGDKITRKKRLPLDLSAVAPL